MATEIDRSLRTIVDEGAPPVRLDEVTGRARRARSGPAAALVAVVVMVVVVVLTVSVLVLADRNDGSVQRPASTTVPLARVPEGVSVQHVGSREVFVRRQGDDVTVFDTNVQHLPTERTLWWCPDEQVFASPTHAELFDADGRAIGGPARAGLDRLPVTVQDGRVTIRSTPWIQDRRGNRQSSDLGQGPAGWATGPGSFCNGALEAGSPVVRSILYVTALGTIGYDSGEYHVPAGPVEIRVRGAAGQTFGFLGDAELRRKCGDLTTTGPPDTCRVTLPKGRYRVGSTIPSHREAGMVTTIVAD